MEVAKVAEKGIQKMGTKLEEQWNKSGIEGKVKGLFNKLTKKKEEEPTTTSLNNNNTDN